MLTVLYYGGHHSVRGVLSQRVELVWKTHPRGESLGFFATLEESCEQPCRLLSVGEPLSFLFSEGEVIVFLLFSSAGGTRSGL